MEAIDPLRKYFISKFDKREWVAFAPYRAIELGKFANLDEAKTACEKHYVKESTYTNGKTKTVKAKPVEATKSKVVVKPKKKATTKRGKK